MKIRDLQQLKGTEPSQQGNEPAPTAVPTLSDETLARAMAGVEQHKSAPSGESGDGPNQLLTMQSDQIAGRRMVGHPITLDRQQPEKPIHFRELSGVAQHLVRQLEATGWLRVQKVAPSVLIEVSKFFSREVGVLQDADTGKLRVVLGTANGILKRQLRPGETVIVHTHPVYSSKKDHFATDFRNASKHEEAVIDWSGAISYLKDGHLLNAVDKFGYVEPMPEHRAPFIDRNGDIVGYKRFTDDAKPDHKRRRNS